MENGEQKIRQESAPVVSIDFYSESDKEALLQGIEGIQEIERALTDTRLPGAEISEAYFSEIEKEAREKSGAIFVARSDTKVIGFIACWIERENNVAETPESNTYGYISDAYVSPEHRGQGVFSRLNTQAEQHLSRFEDVKLIRINVLANNQEALAAYENTGYKPEQITLVRQIQRQ